MLPRMLGCMTDFSTRPVALLTGGEGDLARAIGAEFKQAGFNVLAPGRTELDVLDSASVRHYLGKLVRLDLLVNNAGVSRDASITKMTAEDFDHVLDVNLKGAFLVSQVAVKLMSRQRYGHIVNISSYSALSAPAGQANYAAAKAGLIGLTYSIAREYGAHNVRTNCVLPGFLETKMTRQLLADAAFCEDLMNKHALGRLNTTQDVARFMVFLHSMQNVSGQVFQLDSRVRRWA